MYDMTMTMTIQYTEDYHKHTSNTMYDIDHLKYDNDNLFIFNHKHDKYYTELAPALPIYGHRRGIPRARGTNGILSAAALRGRIY